MQRSNTAGVGPRPHIGGYYLNLGCGARYHPSWINIDLSYTGRGVIVHDVSRGIPLPDRSCAVVYHSHVLEHIPRARAGAFMRECFRVMIPGGVIRVAVPDLERICRTYLEKLERAIGGDPEAQHDYEWMMLELYDQTVRDQPGGGMCAYLSAPELRNEDFVIRRIGEEGRGLIQALRCQEGSQGSGEKRPKRAFRERVPHIPRRVRRLYERAVARVLLGSQGLRALDLGRMRLSGEVHQWMYDRYSLCQLMMEAGFEDVIQQQATDSRIPCWASFHLDTTQDDAVTKPDSLYMEAYRHAQE